MLFLYLTFYVLIGTFSNVVLILCSSTAHVTSGELDQKQTYCVDIEWPNLLSFHFHFEDKL